MKKKIVYVAESLGGGVLSYLITLSKGMSKYFDIIILYGVRDQTPENVEELFSSEVKLIEIKNFQRNINPISDFKAYKEIKHHLRIINPDVVHLNSSKAGAIGRILKAFNFKKLKKTKFLYTPHGYPFLMKDANKGKRILYYLVEIVLGKLNTKTIACGKGEYKYSNMISKNSSYINNAVDFSFFKKYLNDNINSKNVVYTVGRISYQKNPTMFNKIAQQNPNITFVWVGDGPDRSELQEKNIKVTGWLSKDEMCNLVKEYKFFILCSRWEGLPLSLLESMSLGKCCLVSNVIGNRDTINNGINGIVFDNIEDFNKKFNKINSGIVENMSSNAINDIKENYSIQSFLDKYKKEYELNLK